MDFLLEKKIGTFSTTGSFESESLKVCKVIMACASYLYLIFFLFFSFLAFVVRTVGAYLKHCDLRKNPLKNKKRAEKIRKKFPIN